MTEEHKLLLLTAAIVIALICIVRWPCLLCALIGHPSARCRDGSLSFSIRRRGTCSHHGGVEEFLPAYPSAS
ncbi:MAG: DUF3761 domain-containing protein [Xanthobacteraceae bacterium]|nr:DUF3761 domain-containing protein [Xanthobacteraceae bacterium]